ncbi:MAG: DMT family transporter [Lachnospiraceae bacterium]|nr:DMT family transporter [Lachnospiraceae bacterium]
MKQNKSIGIFYIVMSAFGFSCMNLFVRLSGDLPSMQKSFFRNLIAFIFAVGIIIKNHEQVRITKESLLPLIMRSAAGTVGIFCNFYAVDHLPVADASMLNKLSPFFVLIFSFLILKEKVRWYQWLCIIVAFLGSLFVIKPSTDIFQNPAAIIGALGGLGAGMAYAFVRLSSKKGVKGPVIVAFFSGFSCLASVPALLINHTPMAGVQVMYLLLAGLAAACAQFALTAAYSHAPAREISIFEYSQIIFSTLLGLIVLHELPDALSFVGYAIIIGASVVMFLCNRKNSVES